ncbi:MAG TPA: hypothetical protein QF804_07265 [Rhodospirillales bacterium]|jgi:hypothetical protein|nr:hypothetical protein [Rhodospirillales bacterium]|tara:strand:- start:126 stop:545 length:420 start_codon:yes stop_codon:yes gene_type:complete
MPKPPDLDALARTYLELWQAQLTALADDENLAEITVRTINLMNSGATTLLADAGDRKAKGRGRAADDETPTDRTDETQTKPGRAASRSPAAPPARRDPGDDVDELARRLALIDERVAALEAGTRRPSARTRRGARRSRT